MRVAVIGAGHIAQQHLGALREIPEANVVGVCDLSPSMAMAASEKFGVPAWFLDHAEMIEKTRPDVLHVTTPPPTHYALALDALEASAHVFVEKPITVEPHELADLLDRARSAGRIVVEDYNYLYNRSVQRLRQLIDRGRLGEVIHVEVFIGLDILGPGSRLADTNLPHPSLKMPGGAIAEFLTHMAYLVEAFVGPHRSVQTLWEKRDPLTPVPWDEMRAQIAAERGTAALTFSAHSQPDVFLVRVHGTKMRAEAHLFEPWLTVEGAGFPVKPLRPTVNELRQSLTRFRGAFGSLRRKLSGGPGAYEGLWELLRRVYHAFGQSTPQPVTMEQIESVNRLMHDLTREIAE